MPSPFDRIFADVRKDLPSVIDAVLKQEVFRVMDDFTQTTNIWQEHVPIKVEPHVTVYPITTQQGKPNRLMIVYLDDGQPQAGPLIFPPPSRANYPPNPNFWPGGPMVMRVPGVLTLPRDLNQSAVWWAVIAKRTAEPVNPDNKYPVIDDWIVDKYADTIGRGIIARLQWEPQKPYSNPMMAAQNQRAYISGRTLARANDGHANVYDAQNWRFPQQFATVNRKGFT
jgi:hypothetical protein